MTETLADPERELALSYAPRPIRARLRVLWSVDERFGTIVAGTTDPIIGTMRLLWWREELTTSMEDNRAEPLLENVKQVIEATGGDGKEWGAMAGGWNALLQDPIGERELDRFAVERGSRLFRLSAELLVDDVPTWVEREGRGWSLTDLACRMSDPATQELAQSMAGHAFDRIPDHQWPARLRALGTLVVLARRDVRAATRRLGSPGRVGRMAWHRLTGR